MLTIKVYPNPWLSRDAAGLPDGRVHVDRVRHIDRPEFVGCTLDTERTVVHERPKRGENRNTRQTTRWLFLGVPSEVLANEGPRALLAQRPVTIPLTEYYLRRILRGELLLADAESAKACGRKFVDPAEILGVSSGTHQPPAPPAIQRGRRKSAPADEE